VRGLIIATAIIAVAASTIHAQEETKRPERRERNPEELRERRQRHMPPILLALDPDQDGVISAAEIEGATAALKALDKDGDGQLSSEEWRRPAGMADRDPAARAAEFVKRTMQSDADGDGKLSQDEAPERMKRSFDRLDADGDGFISQAEIEEMVKRYSQGRGDRSRGAEGGEDRPPRRERPE